MWEGVVRPNRTATYWPQLLWPSAFLSSSPRLLNQGPGGPASLGHVPQSSNFSPTTTAQSGAWGGHSAGCWISLPHVVSNSSDLQLTDFLSSTDWISCALSNIIVQRPPSSCGRHKFHSFNPSTLNVILCYSSTGWTCYLHRCISYFDSPAGP